MLKHVSASQIKDFKACERLWFYTRVLKEKPPQTEAQSRGTTIHGALEAHLKSGAIEPEILERAKALNITGKELSDYVTAMLPFVGKPGEGLTEFRDSIPTYEGGPEYVLVVDHAREIEIENYGIIPQIDDLKTTSDFRYCKTPDELGKDVQMISYAKWALLRLYTERNIDPPSFVSLRHVYVRTRGKRIATARDVLVTPEHVEIQWAGILETVKQMVVVEAKEDRDPANVAATTVNHCDAYGGCFFRSKCFGALYSGNRPFMTLFTKDKGENKMEEKTNVIPMSNGAPAVGGPRLSLAEKVKLKNAGAAAAAAASSVSVPTVTPASAAAPSVPVNNLPICNVVHTMFPSCPCTLVAHSGDHESVSADGGSIHWSQDGKTFGTGKSTSWKPVTLPASIVQTATPAAASTVAQVLPPDAPERTSTPAEVATANAPRGRGRPKKDPAAAPAAASPTTASAVMAGFAPMAAAATAAAAAAQAPTAAALAPGAAVAPVALTCPLKTLYIDCFPVKGSAVMPVMAEGLIAELSAGAAIAASMPDWRLVEFGKGKGAMAVLLRERLAQMPEILVVSSSTPGSDVVIEVLAPHAKQIIKALRG